jgi:Fe-S-cluster containining protein
LPSKRQEPNAAFIPLSQLGAAAAHAGAPVPMPDPSLGPPCHLCSALCCKYFALEIDKPHTPKEHDELRWYLYHQNVVIWVSEGDWYLEVRNVCRHLQPDRSCGIYETRPQICRDYGMPEAEGPCEFFTKDVEYDLFFDTAEKFEAWSKVELEKRALRLERRRAKSRGGKPTVRRAAGGKG